MAEGSISQQNLPNPSEQAVIIYLDGKNLPIQVYKKYDLATLESNLSKRLNERGFGEYDGNQVSATETKLYIYGNDAEQIFKSIKPILEDYPLSDGAIVRIRKGPPGAPTRQAKIEGGRRKQGINWPFKKPV